MKRTISLLLVLAMCLSLCACQSSDYRKAVSQFKSGDYNQARKIFANLGDYKDSSKRVKECDYNIALKLIKKKQYSEAIELLETLEDYQNSAEKIKECEKELELALLRKFAEEAGAKEAKWIYGKYRSFDIKSVDAYVWGERLNEIGSYDCYAKVNVIFTINNIGLLETYESTMGLDITHNKSGELQDDLMSISTELQ